MVVNLLKLILLSDFGKRGQYFFAEFAALLAELLLHLEEVPVGADAVEQAVEEVIKVIAQAVSHEDYVVSQGYLVLCEIVAYFPLDLTFSEFDVFQTLFNFFL